LLVPVACLVWAFWPTLLELAHAWRTNPQNSHGYLVPFFAAYLLWSRRDRMPAAAKPPSWLAGTVLLVAGLALWLFGTYYYYAWVDAISLLPCLAGAWLLIGGRGTLGWAWPAVAFLAFMVPLPYRLANALSEPLQNLATICSTFFMQVLGLPALAEGNVILLNKAEIGIVEACSGLRMLVVFFALATGVAMLMRRPWLDRVLVVLSAIPIALAVNVVRITVTGVLHEMVDSETANAFFHDAAGWFMMPLALVMLWLELMILSRLFVEVPKPAAPRPPRVSRTRAAKSGAPATRRDKSTIRTADSRSVAAKETPVESCATQS
jgi:exosortase